jgi:hypothetical protein
MLYNFTSYLHSRFACATQCTLYPYPVVCRVCVGGIKFNPKPKPYEGLNHEKNPKAVDN